ncbi:MAG: IS110 family transposase [Phenylobacterium sp.]|uniref:IS110 family transposase n=1 Tax=Phenylobacterium sp. TaxID=1871053 RepID=UPI003919C8D1
MKFDAALDVSVSKSSLCVVSSEDGQIVLETTVATEPEAIAEALKPYASRLRRLGHEAGSLAPWLQRELQALGLPAVVLETRHAHGVLRAQRNKTDRADARGLAQIVRSGWYKVVHVKTEASHRLRFLLAARRSLKRKQLDIENQVRHGLKVFGVVLRPGMRRGPFPDQVREALAADPALAAICEPLLAAWSMLLAEHNRLHKALVKAAGEDELCRRFMAIPGVGVVTAATFKAAVDEPRRFRKSRTVGAHFGLTSRRIQSGDTIDFDGRISKCGDKDVRTVLYEAASSMLGRCNTWCSIRAWGLKVAQRRGRKRAVVAVARKLATVMHAMWRTGEPFQFSTSGREPVPNGGLGPA